LAEQKPRQSSRKRSFVAWLRGFALSALPISPYGETACRLWAALALTPSFGEGAVPLYLQLNEELQMSQQSNFDFNQFNTLTERKPAGLQIYLAQQLLSNALWSFEKYDNPRQEEVRDALNSLKALRAQLKDDAAARATAAA